MLNETRRSENSEISRHWERSCTRHEMKGNDRNQLSAHPGSQTETEKKASSHYLRSNKEILKLVEKSPCLVGQIYLEK